MIEDQNLSQASPVINQASDQSEKLHKRHFRSFWPIVIIAVLSATVGGLLVWIAYNQGLDEQISSLLPGANLSKLHRVSRVGESAVKDWQTYNNKEYGFEFKYPSDWVANAISPVFTTKEFAYSQQSEANKIKKFKDYYASLLAKTGQLPSGKTLTGYATSFQDVAYPCKSSDLENVVMDGISALKCQTSFSEFGASSVLSQVFILKDKKIFQLIFFVRDELPIKEQDKYFKIFDQILSTFKFIEPKALEDTSGWQTYKNEEYGFEFKYPSDWEFTEQTSNNQKGFFIAKDKSYFGVLPNGEFDYGTPWQEPKETSLKLGGKDAIKTEWTGWNKENPYDKLVFYHFVAPIKNWQVCSKQEPKNCNRIDIFTSTEDDYLVITQILSTFKFTE